MDGDKQQKNFSNLATHPISAAALRRGKMIYSLFHDKYMYDNTYWYFMSVVYSIFKVRAMVG